VAAGALVGEGWHGMLWDCLASPPDREIHNLKLDKLKIVQARTFAGMVEIVQNAENQKM
jgi:hypothetical protein